MFAFFLQSMNRTDRSPVGLHPASAENTSFPTSSTALVANVCWSIRTHTHVHRKAKDLCLEVVTLAALSMQELSLHWHLCTVTAIHVWWVLHTHNRTEIASNERGGCCARTQQGNGTTQRESSPLGRSVQLWFCDTDFFYGMVINVLRRRVLFDASKCTTHKLAILAWWQSFQE